MTSAEIALLGRLNASKGSLLWGGECLRWGTTQVRSQVRRRWLFNAVKCLEGHQRGMIRRCMYLGEVQAKGGTLLREAGCIGKVFSLGGCLGRSSLCLGKVLA